MVYSSDSHGDGTGSILAAAFGYTLVTIDLLRRLKLLDSSLVSLSARYDLINFDLWPGIVCPEKEGLGPALQRAYEHTVVICTTTTFPRVATN